MPSHKIKSFATTALVALFILTVGACLNSGPSITVTESASTSPVQPGSSNVPNPTLLNPRSEPTVSAGQATLKDSSRAAHVRIEKGTALQSDGEVSIQIGKPKKTE